MQKQGVVPQACILHYLYITYSKCTEKEYGIKYAQFISQKYWFSYMTRWWTDFIMNWRRDYAFSIYNKMPHYLTDHIAQVHSWSKTKWNLGIYMDLTIYYSALQVTFVLQYLLFWDVVWHWFTVCNIQEELKTSSTPQQKPKILQHLFFSASSVLCITVCFLHTVIHKTFPFIYILLWSPFLIQNSPSVVLPDEEI